MRGCHDAARDDLVEGRLRCGVLRGPHRQRCLVFRPQDVHQKLQGCHPPAESVQPGILMSDCRCSFMHASGCLPAAPGLPAAGPVPGCDTKIMHNAAYCATPCLPRVQMLGRLVQCRGLLKTLCTEVSRILSGLCRQSEVCVLCDAADEGAPDLLCTRSCVQQPGQCLLHHASPHLKSTGNLKPPTDKHSRLLGRQPA